MNNDTERTIMTLSNIRNRFNGNCTTYTLVPISRIEVEAIDEAIKIIENQKSVIEELEYLKADIRFQGFYNERIEDLIDKHISVLKGE